MEKKKKRIQFVVNHGPHPNPINQKILKWGPAIHVF